MFLYQLAINLKPMKELLNLSKDLIITYVPLPVGYQPKANEGTAKPEQRSY
jgi:hypothetical protein